ncbi:MAG: hypothetical protein LQ337_005810 [Flavoplaca oasis]|nr:MAG: hypothetical protein LQ337_005810 [Flavoplaca oasis]
MVRAVLPRCPDLEGRPVDIGLLLQRDHVAELRDWLQDTRGDERRIPPEVILPFLDNIDTLYDILLNQDASREHIFDAVRSAQDIGFRIRGCAKRRTLPPSGYIEEWEDEEEELDIKEEDFSVDDERNVVATSVPRLRRILRKRDKLFNNRNPRVVTIKVMEPEWQSEVLRIGQARVADMVSSDMVLQGLGPGSFSIRILPSGHIRLMMPTARRARQLKDRHLFKPLSFGKDTYVQQIRG